MEQEHDEATAYHEAGHAVMALALGRPVRHVSVLPDRESLGLCEFGADDAAGPLALPVAAAWPHAWAASFGSILAAATGGLLTGRPGVPGGQRRPGGGRHC